MTLQKLNYSERHKKKYLFIHVELGSQTTVFPQMT